MAVWQQVTKNYIFRIGHTVVIGDRNRFEKLLAILEFTHFIENQTPSGKRRKSYEFTVSVAINIAGLNISE